MPHGCGGRSTVLPQRHESSLNTASRHGRSGPCGTARCSGVCRTAAACYTAAGTGGAARPSGSKRCCSGGGRSCAAWHTRGGTVSPLRRTRSRAGRRHSGRGGALSPDRTGSRQRDTAIGSGDRKAAACRSVRCSRALDRDTMSAGLRVRRPMPCRRGTCAHAAGSMHTACMRRGGTVPRICGYTEKTENKIRICNGNTDTPGSMTSTSSRI